jgi:hypothetical protein
MLNAHIAIMIVESAIFAAPKANSVIGAEHIASAKEWLESAKNGARFAEHYATRQDVGLDAFHDAQCNYARCIKDALLDARIAYGFARRAMAEELNAARFGA